MTFIFTIFSLILLFAAVAVITVRNPVRAALFLVLAFFASAGIWLLLHAEFLAIALVLVYVGAVMVLFLFVVMMLDINVEPLREGFTRHFWAGLVVAAATLFIIVMVVVSHPFAPPVAGVESEVGNTAMLGKVLYTDYLYPFEIAAAILLVAMVAAIALTMRPTRHSKAQRPERQVAVRREDRVRLVQMATENPESGGPE